MRQDVLLQPNLLHSAACAPRQQLWLRPGQLKQRAHGSSRQRGSRCARLVPVVYSVAQ